MLIKMIKKTRSTTKVIYFLVFLFTVGSCEKEENLYVSSITINHLPNIVNYFGEKQRLNLEGLEIILKYNNSKEQYIEFDDFSENNIICIPEHEEILTKKTKNVEIIHTTSDTSIELPISINKIKVTDLTIKKLPDKTKYYLGESFEVEGLEIALHFNDGNDETIGVKEFESKNIECSLSDSTILTNPEINFKLTHTETNTEVVLPIEIRNVKDIDNNSYPLSKIGDQIWIAENLRTSKLNDGTPINHVVPDNDKSTWLGLETPAFDWRDGKEYAEESKYGAYYNYYTVETQKLCPNGFHVPSLAEWKILEDFLAANGYSGIEAKAIKSIDNWEPYMGDNALNGSDNFGFNAKPGGALAAGRLFNIDGPNGDAYIYGSHFGKWWTSTKTLDGQARFISLYSEDNTIDICTTIEKTNYTLKSGMNVRCIKD